MARSTSLNRGALAAFLLRQHNVVTRHQAVAAGMTTTALRQRLRPEGRWQALLPGVYLALTGTPTADQLDMAALLYAGAGSVITGQAALRRHGLTGDRPGVVDVLGALVRTLSPGATWKPGPGQPPWSRMRRA